MGLTFALQNSIALSQPRPRPDPAEQSKCEGVQEPNVGDLIGKPSKVVFDTIEARLRSGATAGVGFRECAPFGRIVRAYRISGKCKMLVFLSPNGLVESIELVNTSVDQLFVQANARYRSALQLLHEAPLLNGYEYDPVRAIRAANSLIRLRKHDALNAVDEYIQLVNANCLNGLIYEFDENRIILVLMLAFADHGAQSRIRIAPVGNPEGGPQKSERFCPLFPLELEGELPYLVVGHYSISGTWPSVKQVVYQLREQGNIRKVEYRPTLSPVDGASKLLASLTTRPYASGPSYNRARQETDVMVQAQALRASGISLPTTENSDVSIAELARQVKMEWRSAIEPDGPRSLIWNTSDQRFVSAAPRSSPP